MKKTILLPLLVIFLSTANCLAQTTHTGWVATFNTFKLNSKFSIHSDFQWRGTDELTHMQSLLLRGGLSYHFNKGVVATAGYAYISARRSIGDVDGYFPEHRIWQQLVLNHKLDRIAVSHRFRLEQRFIGQSIVEEDRLKTDEYGQAHRVRYFIRNIIPFRKSETFSKGFFGAVQNEVFLNIGNKKNVNGDSFDQNRLYLAIGYRLSPALDLEAGYINQYINGRTGHSNNQIAQLATYIRL